MRLYHGRVRRLIGSLNTEALCNDWLYPCLTLTPKATIFSVMVNQIKMSAGIELHKSCYVILKNYIVAALSHLSILFLSDFLIDCLIRHG